MAKEKRMSVFTYILGMYKTNCYLITDGKDAVIVDPADRAGYLLSKLEEKGLSLKRILLTHAHFDHIMATNELKAQTCAVVCAGFPDKEGLQDVEKSYLLQLGRRTEGIKADVLFTHGDTFCELGENVTVLLTAGHTKGSVCYVIGRDIFCGDLVFKDGFGRCAPASSIPWPVPIRRSVSNRARSTSPSPPAAAPAVPCTPTTWLLAPPPTA